MLPLGLFRSRAFSGANAVTFAVYFALGGATFLLVLQLERGLGWPPVAAGASLVPTTLLTLVLSPFAGRACGRVGARPFLVMGPLVVAIALVLLGRIGPGAEWARDVLPAAAALGLGLGLTVAPLTTAVLEAAPPERAGVASAVNNAVARLAGLLAVAALPAAGAISPADLAGGSFTVGYRRAMEISGALAAAGALVALFALAGRPSRTPAHITQAGAAARGVRGRAPPGRRPPGPRGRGRRRGSPPRG
jgi:MFS family permease